MISGSPPPPILPAGDRHPLTDVLHNVLRVEPANFLICSPEFRSLVDIDTTGLLGVCLTEFLVVFSSLNLILEDPPLGCKVRSARETES